MVGQGVVHVDGLVETPRFLVCGGEVVARAECVRVVGAEGAVDVADEALEQVDRLLSASRLKVGFGKVAACAERVGVVISSVGIVPTVAVLSKSKEIAYTRTTGLINRS